MGNSQSELKRKFNKLKIVKRTIIKFSVAPDLDVVWAVIKKAPTTVIVAILYRALNCCEGTVHIPSHLIPCFKRHNHHFDYLVDRWKSISSKRHLILQHVGALSIISELLKTVLGTIGESLYPGLCAQMTSSFSYKVLIEQAEQDRLKKRQLRKHSP